MSVPPSYREVFADGKRIETVVYALPGTAPAGNARTIVLLHEGLGSVAMWRDFPSRVAQQSGCNVLVYSRYGHGKSERLQKKRSVDFMHHEAQVVLPELQRQFEIERPILFGHSDGGSIALIYAGTFPLSVRGLILEAPHVFVEEMGLQSIRAIRGSFDSSGLREKLARYHDHVEETFRGWNDIWLHPQFRAWNIEEYVDKIRCPALIIQGQNDEYGTLAQVAAIERRVTAQTLILPQCGHSPHRDQPEQVLAAIGKFVAALRD